MLSAFYRNSTLRTASTACQWRPKQRLAANLFQSFPSVLSANTLGAMIHNTGITLSAGTITPTMDAANVWMKLTSWGSCCANTCRPARASQRRLWTRSPWMAQTVPPLCLRRRRRAGQRIYHLTHSLLPKAPGSSQASLHHSQHTKKKESTTAPKKSGSSSKSSSKKEEKHSSSHKHHGKGKSAKTSVARTNPAGPARISTMARTSPARRRSKVASPDAGGTLATSLHLINSCRPSSHLSTPRASHVIFLSRTILDV